MLQRAVAFKKSWPPGPLFGRGFAYEVMEINGKWEMPEGKAAWETSGKKKLAWPNTVKKNSVGNNCVNILKIWGKFEGFFGTSEHEFE